MDVKDLVGLTLTKFEQRGDDEIYIESTCGRKFKFYHSQSCCEHVYIEEVHGHYDDLVGSPLTLAEEASNDGPSEDYESCTWTFYRFATVKGYVTIRWLGTSNGYYSESVDFEEYGD
jgi:hypothetical protein